MSSVVCPSGTNHSFFPDGKNIPQKVEGWVNKNFSHTGGEKYTFLQQGAGTTDAPQEGWGGG